MQEAGLEAVFRLIRRPSQVSWAPSPLAWREGGEGEKSQLQRSYLDLELRGTWLAQSGKPTTLDLMAMSSNPMVGVEITLKK